MVLIHLDAYCLEDPLFLQGLARALAQKSSGRPPCILVHGSGEWVERLLEREGLFVDRVGGVLDLQTEAARALLERGIREQNQKIVATMTDGLVSAVGVLGASRRLLVQDEGGRVTVGRGSWLTALARQHVVPVVAALAHTERENLPVEVDITQAVIALAEGVEDAATVVFFTRTNRAGLFENNKLQEVVAPEAVRKNPQVYDPPAIERVVAAGLSVYLTSPLGLVQTPGIQGTQVR